MLCNSVACTGCSACYAICNFDAITMQENNLGEMHPVVDNEKCKNCGLCEKVCPVINNTDFKMPEICYAAYTKNESDITTVASGGVATAFGRYVLSKNGAVFGTVLGREGSFECAENEEALENFKGSKYVYIFPNKIYREVKAKLEEGKECLFVGTPCQVDGLRAFLRKDYDNLITVDLICHGTPPFKYLKNHLSGHTSSYDRITFRGKNNFSLTCYNNGAEVYSMSHHMDEYFYSFLNSITYREVCYNCNYARRERVSDITIGDFWGLADDALSGYTGRKSVVLINTQKGKAFFDKAKYLLEYEARDVDEAIKGNAQLRTPSKRHKNRDVFKREYIKAGFSSAMKKSGVSRTIKINQLKGKVKALLKRR